MGSDESHFNVLLIVRDKATRQCPQTTTCEEKGEPKQIRTDVPLLTSLSAFVSGTNAFKCSALLHDREMYLGSTSRGLFVKHVRVYIALA